MLQRRFPRARFRVLLAARLVSPCTNRPQSRWQHNTKQTNKQTNTQTSLPTRILQITPTIDVVCDSRRHIDEAIAVMHGVRVHSPQRETLERFAVQHFDSVSDVRRRCSTVAVGSSSLRKLDPCGCDVVFARLRKTATQNNKLLPRRRQRIERRHARSTHQRTPTSQCNYKRRRQRLYGVNLLLF